MKPSAFRKLPIRTQLVIYFVTIFGGLFTVFSLGMYLHVSRTHRDEFDAALHYSVLHTARTLTTNQINHPQLSAEFPRDVEVILPFSLAQALMQISTGKGQILTRSQSLNTLSLPIPAMPFATLLRRKVITSEVELISTPNQRGPNGRYRVVTYAFKHPELGDLVVQAAASLTLLEVSQDGLLVFLMIAIPLALAMSAFGGTALGRKAMQPVAAITRKATEIEAHHLSERIPVPHNSGEIRELALTLNKLLDRLESAFRTQQTFIADASHQLKTPLAILKGELAVFRQKTRSENELEEFLASADQEVGHLSRVVEDLLVLARAEADVFSESVGIFRLDEKMMESVARHSRYAERQNVNLAVDLHTAGDGDFQAKGDAELVRSLIDNLVENAIKYSPPGSTVHISLKETGQHFRIEVSDEGRGIPAEALPYIFDRFYRAEPNRKNAAGSGLGLSIVKKIAELHGGSVTASNLRSGGALLSVQMPKSVSTDST